MQRTSTSEHVNEEGKKSMENGTKQRTTRPFSSPTIVVEGGREVLQQLCYLRRLLKCLTACDRVHNKKQFMIHCLFMRLNAM